MQRGFHQKGTEDTKVIFGFRDWTFGAVVGFWLACDLGGEGRVRSPS
jgi:hypothetical protein